MLEIEVLGQLLFKKGIITGEKNLARLEKLDQGMKGKREPYIILLPGKKEFTMKMTTGIIMCIIFSLLVLCHSGYSQQIYRWVDEKGNINYTTRYDSIPQQFRDQVPEPPEEAEQKQLTAPEEVTQFFANYVRYYNQKDIEGLLSLFSPKAVQNLEDRFDQIKEMYSDFFDESQELSYHIDDMKIRIYQNTMYVIDARYTVDQILKKAGKRRTWTGDIRWTLMRENGALKIRYLDYRPQKSP